MEANFTPTLARHMHKLKGGSDEPDLGELQARQRKLEREAEKKAMVRDSKSARIRKAEKDMKDAMKNKQAAEKAAKLEEGLVWRSVWTGSGVSGSWVPVQKCTHKRRCYCAKV